MFWFGIGLVVGACIGLTIIIATVFDFDWFEVTVGWVVIILIAMLITGITMLQG